MIEQESQISLPIEPRHLASESEKILSLLDDALVIRASATAEIDFAEVKRKIPKGSGLTPKPYFTHVDAVGKTLAEFGYDTEVIAAGYLHDHIEDLPTKYSKESLALQFTPRVSELVDWVTQQDKSLPWQERNRRYAERIKFAPNEALAISAADKLSNITDSLDFLTQGYPISTMFKAGWSVNSKKFHELLEIFRGKVKPGLVDKLEYTLKMYDLLGSELEP